ncbi:PriCT-2 domain-containing protein, partial [Pseudanabaenaceae cyanobacterium LEGE 13415]|nr:PriCT-2 domain-containing protein [Pseudanabaenaceae cyanobacterium LEGE 13415]
MAKQHLAEPAIFKFAVNTQGCDKNWNFRRLSANFRDREGTLNDIIGHIRQGHAICAGLLNGRWRSKSNFVGSQWVLCEIDNATLLKDDQGNIVRDQAGKGIKIYQRQMTLEEAIAHPFVQKYCSLIYTTPSHTSDWHRFRFVFQLPELIGNIETYEAIVQFLLGHLPHDPACKDGIRVFYGNTNAEFPLINPAACLPREWVHQAIIQAERTRQERAEQEKITTLKRQQFQQLIQNEGWDTDALIQQALNHIPPRTPGSGNYNECRQVLMALANHYGAVEAELIAQSWSPSIKGTTWNIAQKIRSFRRKGITIGTLFHTAAKYGFRFPQRNIEFDPQEPNQEAYRAFVAEQEERSRLEQIQAEHHEYDRLKLCLRWFQQGLEQKGFGKCLKRKAKITASTIEYVPGKLPRPEDYSNPPRIVYKRAQLSQLLWEARIKGWHDILDTTPPGGGKSHSYASLSPLELGVQKIEDEKDNNQAIHRVWLLSRNHRNPTTEPAEHNYEDLPVRNAGFVKETTRKTPLGADFLRWAKHGEAVETQGNCHLTDLIHKAANKGLSTANQTAAINPFCEICRHKDYCKESSGNGFGFRFERSQVFQFATQVRASIDSLPDPSDYSAYSGDVAILDEAFTQLRPIQSITATLSDFDTQWAELEANLPAAHALLQPLRQALRPLVAGEVRQHHGYDDEKLKTLIPKAPTQFNKVLEEAWQTLSVNFSTLTEEPDQIQTKNETAEITRLKNRTQRQSQKLERLRLELAELQEIEEELKQGQIDLFRQYQWSEIERQAKLNRLAKLPQIIEATHTELEADSEQLNQLLQHRKLYRSFNRSQFQNAQDRLNTILDRLPSQWLLPFLAVWSESIAGAIRVGAFGGLTITTYNDRHNAILNHIKTRIYLDATATPEVLSLYRQIPTSQILWITQAQPRLQNLAVTWIQGLGLAGKDRSLNCDGRINALLEVLKEQFPDIAVFDWQSKKQDTNADGHWFSDFTRGTNEFANRSAIVAIGLPLPNAGVFYDLWKTLTKQSEIEHLSFNDFYQHQIDAEVIQVIGRLRANRRLDESLSVFFIGDTEQSKNLNYQLPNSLDYTICQAREITPKAATSTELAWII